MSRDVNPRYWLLLNTFKRLFNCPVLINTSFTVRGEPIVGSPADVYLCFMRTEMDYLVINNMILDKNEQPQLSEDGDWCSRFELD